MICLLDISQIFPRNGQNILFRSWWLNLVLKRKVVFPFNFNVTQCSPTAALVIIARKYNLTTVDFSPLFCWNQSKIVWSAVQLPITSSSNMPDAVNTVSNTTRRRTLTHVFQITWNPQMHKQVCFTGSASGIWCELVSWTPAKQSDLSS